MTTDGLEIGGIGPNSYTNIHFNTSLAATTEAFDMNYAFNPEENEYDTLRHSPPRILRRTDLEVLSAWGTYQNILGRVHQAEKEISALPNEEQESLLESLAIDSPHHNLPTSLDAVLGNPDIQAEDFVTSSFQLNSALETYNSARAVHEERKQKLILSHKIDTLTGLTMKEFMYSEFKDMIIREAFKVEKTGNTKYVGALFIDLDNFGKTNDSFGHGNGDKILAHAGSQVLDVLRDHELGIRYGGEELCAYTVSSQEDGARIAAEKLRDLAAEYTHHLKDSKTQRYFNPYKQTLSIGYSSLALTPEKAHQIKEIYDQYEVRITQASDRQRSALFMHRTAALDSLITPMLNTLNSQSDAAMYDVKLNRKNGFLRFEQEKQDSGYYEKVSQLYPQAKDAENPMNLMQARLLADQYLKDHNLK